MHIKKNQLLNGCLFSSIAHAIMTNIYPDLAYEMSWDGNSFSLQNGVGTRGTITFLEDSCVGAIRNEYTQIIQGKSEILQLIRHFPQKLIDVAQSDTLQYLMDYNNGINEPAISTAFWCDNIKSSWVTGSIWDYKRDFSLFHACTLAPNQSIKIWEEYYEMDAKALYLLSELMDQKAGVLSKRIIMSDTQKEMIPGQGICNECIESFGEIHIIL